MAQEYFEAILIWTQSGPSPAVAQWMAERGLQTRSMRQGLLISGERATFEFAFQVELDLESLPLSLPVPDELREAVASITIPKPPDY